jgi:hypothetical protein
MQTAQIPEETQRLYDELANHIHAKDDGGVRRVFRELLNIGRSRQEIVDAIVRLTDPTPYPRQNAKKAAEQSASANPGRAAEVSETEESQNPGTGPDTPVTNSCESFGIDTAKPERARAQFKQAWRVHQNLVTWHAQTIESGRTQQVDPANQSSPEEHRVEVAAIALTRYEEKGSASVPAEAEGAAISAEAENDHGELDEVTADPKTGSGVSEEHQPARFRKGPLENGQLGVPERFAAKLHLAAASKPEGKPNSQEQMDIAEGSSGLQRLRWRTRILGILAGVSVLAAALGGSYALWGLFWNKLAEVSLADVQGVVSAFQNTRNNRSTAPDEATGRETLRKNEVPGSHAADNGPKATLQEHAAKTGLNTIAAGRGSPLAPPSDAAAMAPAATAKNDPNTEALSTRSGQLLNEIPWQTMEPSAASGPSPSAAQENRGASENPTSVAARPHSSSIDVRALVARGDQALGDFDLASARLFYQRAAEAGDGLGALRMGMSFDPDFLRRLGGGVQGDPDQASSWYRRASALGNSEAEALERQVRSSGQQTMAGSRTIQVSPDHRSDQPQDQAPKARRTTHRGAKPLERAGRH